jgi:hypothetical protein
MLRRVTLVRTDVSEETSASFIRVTRIAATKYQVIYLRSVRGLLVAASIVPISQILVTLMEQPLVSYETSVLTRAIRHNIQENTILHSHRRENLKSYIGTTSSPILVTRMMEELRSSGKSVLTKATRRNIP